MSIVVGDRSSPSANSGGGLPRKMSAPVLDLRVEQPPPASSSSGAAAPVGDDPSALLAPTDAHMSDVIPAPGTKRNWTDTPAFKIVVTGAGFMSDAYDLFIVNLVLVIIQYDRPDLFAGGKASTTKGTLATIVLIGSVLGQLTFGAIADRIGRRIGFVVTLALVTIGALLSATSSDTGSMSLIVWLSIWRFIMGFGIGGEYPLSATVSSENSTHVKRRGRDVATVFSMQGVGMTLAPIMTLIFLSAAPPHKLGVVWRLSLAFGAVPGLLIFYFRYKMHETPAFKQHKQSGKLKINTALPKPSSAAVGGGGGAAVATSGNNGSVQLDDSPTSNTSDSDGGGSTSLHPRASSAVMLAASRAAVDPAIADRDAPREPTHWEHFVETVQIIRRWWRELLGAAGSWFLFDIVFYSNGLFSASILSGTTSAAPDPMTADPQVVHAHLIATATQTLYLALLALPGYYCGVLLIDRIGRRKLILSGWAAMIVLYVIIGIALPALEKQMAGFYILYGLSFFCCNAGPNVSRSLSAVCLFPSFRPYNSLILVRC